MLAPRSSRTLPESGMTRRQVVGDGVDVVGLERRFALVGLLARYLQPARDALGERKRKILRQAETQVSENEMKAGV